MKLVNIYSSIVSFSGLVFPKQVGHKLMFEITLHGFLLWASMGFLMPVGILAIRMSNREECGRRLKILFYVHAVSQASSSLLLLLHQCVFPNNKSGLTVRASLHIYSPQLLNN